MTIYTIFLLLFLTFAVGVAAWLLFIWATRTGQFDDPEGPKFRMLDEEEGEEREK